MPFSWSVVPFRSSQPRPPSRAMRAALLAAAAAAAAARGGTVTIAGDQLGGGVAVELPGAPLWRLDRAFQRTCVQLTCSDGKARPRSARQRCGVSFAHLRCTRRRDAQKYEAFEGSDREDVLSRFKQASLSGCAPAAAETPNAAQGTYRRAGRARQLAARAQRARAAATPCSRAAPA